MNEKIYLNDLEREIEDNFESLKDISNMDQEMASLKLAALSHIRKNKSITLRINENDLEAIKIKASKFGVGYQTYINMLIHKDAVSIS